MAENKKRKKYFAIWVVAAIVFILIGALVSFIVSSKFAERVSRVFSDLNPFKPEGKPDDGGGSNLSKAANATAAETTTTGGGGGDVAEEVVYGSGKLRIVNWLSDSELGKGYHTTFHQSGGTDELDYYDAYYSAFFSPSGKSTKIISRITGYELRVDTRALNSLSTIYLELSLHSQSGDAITLNSTNELRLSFPLASSGYNFSGKTITLQQYNPNNTGQSFPSYDVRDVIDNDGGVIALARLDSSYNSEEPYAYFRLRFS